LKKEYLVWMLKGAAMGAADAVPGVSGGTMALITGIYERFIGALASFKPSLFGYVKARDFAGLWRAVDGSFLLCVGVGILLSLFSVLNLMDWLLHTCAPVVWAFFTGIILMSLWHLLGTVKWSQSSVALYSIGLFVAAGLSFLTASTIQVSPLTLVIGGTIAISAMLLPGISGSFMLLLLGLYEPVVSAVSERDVVTVLWVALGCGIGILSVSQLLNWALKRWHEVVMAFMLGFVAGALIKVWPWQNDGEWMLPSQYASATQGASWFVLALFAFIAGAVIVWFLHKKSAD
jgi:putative membrane protein